MDNPWIIFGQSLDIVDIPDIPSGNDSPMTESTSPANSVTAMEKMTAKDHQIAIDWPLPMMFVGL